MFWINGVQPRIERRMYPMDYSDLVEKYSAEYSVPREIVYAVIRTESKFDESAVSSHGAQGLMQLTEDTFYWITYRIGETHDISEITNPEINIKYGVWYLSYLIEKYGDNETAYAAYNAGPSRVDSWLDEGGELGDIPYEETEDYVQRVTSATKIYRRLLEE